MDRSVVSNGDIISFPVVLYCLLSKFALTTFSVNSGFCTPGIIVSIYTLFANNATVPQIEEHLDGNLCRCTGKYVGRLYSDCSLPRILTGISNSLLLRSLLSYLIFTTQGYRPIWDAARSLCEDYDAIRGPCGIACRDCPERDECELDCNIEDKTMADAMVCSSSAYKMKQYKDTFLKEKSSWIQQPNFMFPKVLQDCQSAESKDLEKPLMVVDRTEFHAGGTWFKPTSLEDLLALLQEFGGSGTGACKIVVGNTEVGIGTQRNVSCWLIEMFFVAHFPLLMRPETRFKQAVYPRLIYPSDKIKPLYNFEVSSTDILIGSCCPLSTIQHMCSDLSSQSTALRRTVLPMHDMLRWFASTQIRNVACLGGNLVTASPISDMNPMLACIGAKLILSSFDMEKSTISRRSLAVSDFFLKYRTVDLQPAELVERIEVPIVKPLEYVKPFKQARRREDDISIVTSGMRIRLAVKEGKYVIDDLAIAFGGMAPTTKMATKTMETLIGSDFNAESFHKATETLLDEMKLLESVPGGQAAYRMTLVSSFLYKFYLSVVEELQADIEAFKADPSSFANVSLEGGQLPPAPSIDESEKTGTYNFLSAQKPSSCGTQFYPAPKVATGLEEEMLPKVRDMSSEENSAVGKGKSHMSGPLHCTGEALYCDDIPIPPRTLHACLVLSSQCGSVLESIDVTPALAIPGVVAVYTSDDLERIGGNNELGPIFHDEVLFLPVGQKVTTVMQTLGVCIAESLEAAELGARSVKVGYSATAEKVIVTIDDAIESKSFFEVSRHRLVRGDESEFETLQSAPDSSGAPKVGDIVTVSGGFCSGAQEHFYLETNATLAVPSESDTNLTIYASTQAVTKTQNFCASTTGTPASKVVVRMKRMGGGFGGKLGIDRLEFFYLIFFFLTKLFATSIFQERKPAAFLLRALQRLLQRSRADPLG
jgi:xanthine dehydrogenase/oxidase